MFEIWMMTTNFIIMIASFVSMCNALKPTIAKPILYRSNAMDSTSTVTA